MTGLPESWIETTLGELGTWSSGGTPSRANSSYFGGGIPWVKTGELRDGTIGTTEESLTLDGLANSAARIFPKGTLLVAMYGATIGKLGILGIEAATNQACAALIPNGVTAEIIPFLFYYLLSQRDSLRLLGQGGAQPNISQKVLKGFPCILPPLEEQRRIVAEIESLSAHVRRARQDLDAVPALIEQTRKKLLDEAFSGNLTAKWRTKNPPVESAEELIFRIRDERRKQWEATEQAKMQAKGEAPRDERWKAKYEPALRQTSISVPLPDGWAWASFDEVTLNFDSDRVPLKAADRSIRVGPYPYYGASGIIDSINDYLLDGHYLLIAEDGANLLSRSTPIAFEATGRFWVNNHAHVVKPVELPMAYLREYVESLDLAQYVTGSAQPKLTQRNLNSIPVPVPPPAEAAQIAHLIDIALTHARTLLTQCAEAITTLEAEERAIVTRAFRGELVPQDPNDEPASVLLERIRSAPKAESVTHDSIQTLLQETMKKPTTVDQIHDVIDALPSDDFTFEDLRAQVSGEYNDIKDKVFELLEEKKSPKIRQVFDKKTKRIRFERAVR